MIDVFNGRKKYRISRRVWSEELKYPPTGDRIARGKESGPGSQLTFYLASSGDTSFDEKETVQNVSLINQEDKKLEGYCQLIRVR